MMSAKQDKSAHSAHITPETTLPAAISAWRFYLEDQANSPHTLKAFIADLNLLASYLPPDRTLGSLSTTDLNNFLSWMEKGRGIPCSPKTLARRITSLKAFFRWLHEYGVLLIDPAEKVIQKTVISPIPTILSGDEVMLVLDAAQAHRQASKPDARYLALVSLLFATGIKKSETLALSLNHIDLESEQGPTLFVRYASPQHRYKERKIALPDTWLPILEEYKGQYKLKDQLFPWSQRRLEYLLEDLGREAGLDKHISFEMCRWTCAVNDYLAGVDPDKIRQKLGISKIQWREVGAKVRRLAGVETPPA